MSLFRPGPVPAGVEVKRPVWPTLTPTPTAPPKPALAPRSVQKAEAAFASTVDPAAELAEARLEAARLLQEAAVEAEEAQAAAQQQGYEQGREEGLAAGRAELEALRKQAELELENARLQAESLRQAAQAEAALSRTEAEKVAQQIIGAAKEESHRITEAARAAAGERLTQSQEALVELAVAAAVRLVQGHLALQPQSIIQMVAAGLQRLKDSDCTVRVHPKDLPLLEAQRSVLERELGAGTLGLSPDLSLQRGSYLVHSQQGQIDGTLEQQTERLQAAMRAALGGGHS